MQPTRRYWEAVAVATALATGAIVLDTPVLLVGAATVAGWLLAAQYAFVRNSARLVDGLSIDQSTARDVALVDEPVETTLRATLDAPSGLETIVTARPPISTTAPPADERRIRLPPGGTAATATFDVTAAVAGDHAFEAPAVDVTDRYGLFAESVSRGPSPTLSVDPKRPRDLHVGAGGVAVTATYGGVPAGQAGPGFDPVSLREYVPGDAARLIDWKATARLAEPHVREFEIETDRRTILLLDYRATTAEGPPGQTKFDYLREVALAFVERAHETGDPVGLYTVGEAGPTDRRPSSARTRAYAGITERLRALEPEKSDDRPRTTLPPRRRELHNALADSDGAFAGTLGPFFTTMRPDRLQDAPLLRTARLALSRASGTVWTVVFTDDADRAEVRETVKYARRGDSRVLVFLAPSVLFESQETTDAAAYEQYLDFETFRRTLDGLDRVAAFEVGPGSRLEELLADRRRRQTPVEA